MPRGVVSAVELPNGAKFESIDGEGFVRIREAAKLGRVHPVVLEMGQRLLKKPNGTGAAFTLATPDLMKRAEDVEKMFKGGLRKVAKALDGEHKYKVKSHRDGNRLVFWYAT